MNCCCMEKTPAASNAPLAAAESLYPNTGARNGLKFLAAQNRRNLSHFFCFFHGHGKTCRTRQRLPTESAHRPLDEPLKAGSVPVAHVLQEVFQVVNACRAPGNRCGPFHQIRLGALPKRGVGGE